MKKIVLAVLSCFVFLCVTGESLPRYWLMEEDFIKIGKKELFESEKRKQQKDSFEVLGIEDLENPQYVFFMPLKDVASLSQYAPIKSKKSPLMDSCLHFQIFSLYELLENCSLKAENTFLEKNPYFSYVLYDVSPGSEALFEEHLTACAVKKAEQASLTWRVWKVLIGADVPKYLVCLSFPAKEDLKESNVENVFEEVMIKDIVRGKKSGWMKRDSSLSVF